MNALLLAGDIGGSIFASAFLVTIYFTPALLSLKKRNAVAIFWLNFLAGWTLVGWLVALIWALTKDNPQVIVIERAATRRD